ncbi:MAG: hypothetical protein KKF50_04755 [Nanoarchaeota archaeon]|nr:hypothetical protein [Nanoarchaeota archaeon]
MDKGEKDKIKNYVRYLLSQGRSKKQIHDELVGKGFDRFLIRELVYPNLKLLVYSGIVLIAMILIIGWFYFFMMISGNNIDIKPIAKETTLESVGGIEVSNVEIREENGNKIIEVYLKNNLDEDYDAPIEIKAMSGEFYLTWMELRGIAPGKTLKSSAPGFKTPEKTVKISLNSQEVYEEVFLFA